MDNTVGSLSDEQKSIIVGKLLGDGSLRRKVNTLLEINHSYKQKDYVFWLYEKFKKYVATPPKLRVSGTNRFSYRFTTLSSPELNEFYETFYTKNHKKFISQDIRLNSLTLAIWFMDDGCKSRRSVYLNTQQFSFDEQLILLELLKHLNLKATLNKDKNYYRIRFSGESIDEFIDMVKPYVLPSMLYKLPK